MVTYQRGEAPSNFTSSLQLTSTRTMVSTKPRRSARTNDGSRDRPAHDARDAESCERRVGACLTLEPCSLPCSFDL